MRKEEETGNGLGQINLRGAATKTYRTVEEMRAESGRLRGEYISDDIYDSYMNDFFNRLYEITDQAQKVKREDSFSDATKEVLLEAVRDSTSKASMDRILKNNAQWINYSESITEDLWELKKDVQNMPAPYFEAKPRRVVTPEEALAYIVPDTADPNVVHELQRRGLNVLTYEANNEEDRLEKLNSIPQARFQQWDDTDGDTAAESRGRAEANVRIRSENQILQDTIGQLNRELEKQNAAAAREMEKLGAKIEKLSRETKITENAEVREADAKKLAGRILREYSSKADKAEITAAIKELGDTIVQSTGETIDYEEIRRMADAIAQKVIGSAQAVLTDDTGALAAYQEIVRNIKGVKLKLAEQDRGELDVAGGYEEFRKANFGRFSLGSSGQNVDSFYQELQNSYGAGTFPEVNSPGEMLMVISDVFDRAKPEIGNPYANYMGETMQSLSDDILFDAIGDSLRQMPKTFADRMQAKLDKLKAEDRAKIRELKTDNRKLEAILEKQRARYDSLREQKNARIAEVYAEGTQRAQEARAKERAAKWEKVAAVRDYYREKERAAAESRKNAQSVRKLRDAITKKAKKLYQWLDTNSGKEHIPDSLKGPVGELLQEIDFSSKRKLAGGEDTQNDRAFADRMNRVREILQNQQNYQNGAENAASEFDGFIDLPDGILETMQELSRRAGAMAEAGGSYTVNSMNVQELDALDEILTAMTAAVKQMNSLIENGRYANARTAGADTLWEMDQRAPLNEKLIRQKNQKGIGLSGLNDFFVWKNTVPAYAFKRFGIAGQSMFDEMRQGWGRMAKNVYDAVEDSKKIFTPEEVKAWDKETKSFAIMNFDGSVTEIQMSVSELMSLYELAKRQQAVGHILGGGIQIPSRSTEHYAVSQDTIDNLGNLLTDRQREVADKLQKYMQDKGGTWGNEVSQKRWGIRLFGEQNYFPIETDATDRNADASIDESGNKTQSLYRIMNMGFTKGLTPKASNALVVRPIFDVFSNHIADMAKYNALTIPMLDTLKWYNYREREAVGENGQFTTKTVQRALQRVYGKGATDYFMNFMKDMNGNREGGRGEGFLKGLASNYKVAQIGNNLRVVAQQPTSIARAALKIEPKYLARGAVTKGGYDEMMKNSGLAVWKIGLGFYDVNINSGVRQQLKQDQSWKDRLQDKSTELAGKADEVTWTAMWNACKAEMKDRGYTGEELMAKTTERFENLMLETQVMDSTISRSELMRGTSMAMAEYTGFMSEPVLTYNTLMDAYLDLRDDSKTMGWGDAWKKHQKNVAKTAMCFVLSEALTSAVAAIVDVARDDDEYESALEKWLQHYQENFADNANPLNLVPVVADVYELIRSWFTGEDYQGGSMATEGLIRLGDTIQLISKKLNGTYKGNITDWGAIYKGLQAAGMISGLAIAPVAREITALHNGAVTIYNDVVGNRTGEPLSYWKTYDEGAKSTIKTGMENGFLTAEQAQAALVEQGEAKNETEAAKQVFQWENDATSLYSPLYDAVKAGDDAKVEEFRKKYAELGYTENQVNGKVKEKVKEWYLDPTTAMSRTEGINALVQYAGMSANDAADKMDYWRFLNDFPEANADGRGSVTQDELGTILQQKVRTGELTESEAAHIWAGEGSWKKTYAEWKNKTRSIGSEEYQEFLNGETEDGGEDYSDVTPEEYDEDYRSRGVEPVRTGDVRELGAAEDSVVGTPDELEWQEIRADRLLENRTRELMDRTGGAPDVDSLYRIWSDYMEIYPYDDGYYDFPDYLAAYLGTGSILAGNRTVNRTAGNDVQRRGEAVSDGMWDYVSRYRDYAAMKNRRTK